MRERAFIRGRSIFDNFPMEIIDKTDGGCAMGDSDRRRSLHNGYTLHIEKVVFDVHLAGLTADY